MSTLYSQSIDAIKKYYGVSDLCAMYLFHRAFRSRRNEEDKYLEWSAKLQNALVKADKCLGLEWEKVLFNQEQEELSKHGILIDEQCNEIFRWVDDKQQEDPLDEWSVVSRKKIKKHKISFDKYLKLITRVGLLL